MGHSPESGLGGLLIKPSAWAEQASAAIPKTGQFGSKAPNGSRGC